MRGEEISSAVAIKAETGIDAKRVFAGIELMVVIKQRLTALPDDVVGRVIDNPGKAVVVANCTRQRDGGILEIAERFGKFDDALAFRRG